MIKSLWFCLATWLALSTPTKSDAELTIYTNQTISMFRELANQQLDECILGGGISSECRDQIRVDSNNALNIIKWNCSEWGSKRNQYSSYNACVNSEAQRWMLNY